LAVHPRGHAQLRGSCRIGSGPFVIYWPYIFQRNDRPAARGRPAAEVGTLLEPEVLVIGGGVVGAAVARAIARRGRGVLLVDKGDVCSGASAGNAGLIVPSLAVPLAAPGVLGQGLRWLLRSDSPFYVAPRLDRELLDWLWRFQRNCRPEPMRRAIPVLLALGRASQALQRELAAEFDCGYEARGWLFTFNSAAGLEKGLAEARMLGEFGVAHEPLDAAAVRARVPEIRSSILGGVLYPEDGHVLPERLVRQLVASAVAAGALVRVFTEVRGVEVGEGRVRRVLTSGGEIRPAEVVLAAGSWSGPLGRDLGLRLPIQPAKGYSVTLDVPGAPSALPLYFVERKVALTRWPGRMRLSGTLELGGLDLAINPRRVAAIRRAAQEYLDGLPDFDAVAPWAGLRPVTPDGLPIIGRTRRLGNVILAGGHGMMGITYGAITGELVAQLACGEAPALDLAPFSPDRFD
jgi:D-amino-acid dehydrogenase